MHDKASSGLPGGHRPGDGAFTVVPRGDVNHGGEKYNPAVYSNNFL
ncbi:MAG: hypothetical protein Kow0089_11890 [Desulfobulbaceae bacterium]